MPLPPLPLTWAPVWVRPVTAAAVPPVAIAEEVPLVAPTPIVEADVPPTAAEPALPPVAPVALLPEVALVVAIGTCATATAAARAPIRAPVNSLSFIVFAPLPEPLPAEWNRLSLLRSRICRAGR